MPQDYEINWREHRSSIKGRNIFRMILNSSFKHHTASMRLLFVALTCLAACSALPQLKQKRDILPGDPRYENNHHHSHENVIEDVKSSTGYSLSASDIPQNTYGPPEFQPGVPLNEDYLSSVVDVTKHSALTQGAPNIVHIPEVTKKSDELRDVHVEKTATDVTVEEVKSVTVAPPATSYGIPVLGNVKIADKSEIEVDSQVKNVETVKTKIDNREVIDVHTPSVKVVEHTPVKQEVTHVANDVKTAQAVTTTVTKDFDSWLNGDISNVGTSLGGTFDIPSIDFTYGLPSGFYNFPESTFNTFQNGYGNYGFGLSSVEVPPPLPLSLHGTNSIPTSYSFSQGLKVPRTDLYAPYSLAHFVQRAQPAHVLQSLPSASSFESLSSSVHSASALDTLTPVQPVSYTGTLTKLHADTSVKTIGSLPPTEHTVHTVPSVKSVETVSTVHSVPTVKTISSVHAAPTVETVHTVKTVPTLHTLPLSKTEHTLKALPTLHTLPTVKTAHPVETLSAIHSAPSGEAVSSFHVTPTVATLPTVHSLPPVRTLHPVSTLQSLPTVKTVHPVETLSAVHAVPSVKAIPSVHVTPTVETLSTVHSFPTVKAIPSLHVTPTLATFPTVHTLPKVESLSTLHSVPSVKTLHTVDTVPTIHSVPALKTIPSLHVTPTLETFPTVHTFPKVESLSTLHSVPSVKTLHTVDTVPTIHSVPAVKTFPSLHVTPTVGTFSAVHSLPTVKTVPTLHVTPTVDTLTRVDTLHSIDNAQTLSALHPVSTLSVETDHTPTNVFKSDEHVQIQTEKGVISDFIHGIFSQFGSGHFPGFPVTTTTSTVATPTQNETSYYVANNVHEDSLTIDNPLLPVDDHVVSSVPSASDYVQLTDANGGYIYRK